jgi:hypothetical protein
LEGLSIHHQEFKAVHTATGTVCVKQILLPAASGNEMEHVDCYSRINKFEKLVHLVGFTIEINLNVITRLLGLGCDRFERTFLVNFLNSWFVFSS